MKIKIISKSNFKQVSLSPQSIKKLGILSTNLNLQLGSRSIEVEVNVDGNLPEDFLGVSEELLNQFTIPYEIDYEVFVKEATLHLGPIIGFLAFTKETKMTLSKLEELKVYCEDYDSIKGLIFIFAEEGIDSITKTIKGQYYSPPSEDHEGLWKSGLFPYPDVVYNRAEINTETYLELTSIIGNKIFNTYSDTSFDKWELYRMLSPLSHIQKALPETRKLDSIEALNTMLDLHNSVYLKPAVGTLSKGIIKVTRGQEGYIFTYPRTKKKVRATRRSVKTSEQVSQLVETLKTKGYLVQQALQMKRFKKRGIDFRVIMLKNARGEWNCEGIFAKFGKKYGIVTNFSLVGFLLPGQRTLELAYTMTKQQALEKIEEIEKFCTEVCKVFDNYGTFGDFGIDLIIDEDEKIWILEVNTVKPYHEFPMFMKDEKTYKKITAIPLKYAKYLSGFNQNL